MMDFGPGPELRVAEECDERTPHRSITTPVIEHTPARRQRIVQLPHRSARARRSLPHPHPPSSAEVGVRAVTSGRAEAVRLDRNVFKSARRMECLLSSPLPPLTIAGITPELKSNCACCRDALRYLVALTRESVSVRGAKCSSAVSTENRMRSSVLCASLASMMPRSRRIFRMRLGWSPYSIDAEWRE